MNQSYEFKPPSGLGSARANANASGSASVRLVPVGGGGVLLTAVCYRNHSCSLRNLISFPLYRRSCHKEMKHITVKLNIILQVYTTILIYFIYMVMY